MARKKQFVVIGLGRFGETVAGELMRLGHEVLGIDTDERRTRAMADRLTRAVTGNASDEKVLEELNIKQFDAAVVAIGSNLEGSILVTLALKQIGVRLVWVKALNDAHHRIVQKLGADLLKSNVDRRNRTDNRLPQWMQRWMPSNNNKRRTK